MIAASLRRVRATGVAASQPALPRQLLQGVMGAKLCWDLCDTPSVHGARPGVIGPVRRRTAGSRSGYRTPSGGKPSPRGTRNSRRKTGLPHSPSRRSRSRPACRPPPNRNHSQPGTRAHHSRTCGCWHSGRPAHRGSRPHHRASCIGNSRPRRSYRASSRSRRRPRVRRGIAVAQPVVMDTAALTAGRSPVDRSHPHTRSHPVSCPCTYRAYASCMAGIVSRPQSRCVP
jgi:hypothetical protein